MEIRFSIPAISFIVKRLLSRFTKSTPRSGLDARLATLPGSEGNTGTLMSARTIPAFGSDGGAGFSAATPSLISNVPFPLMNRISFLAR